MATNCQVCGNPIFGHRNMGFNVDGSINNDFCSACYKFGNFVTSDGNPDENNEGLLNNALLPLFALGSDTITNTPALIRPMF